MADTNGTLSPPPLREALTYAGTWLPTDTWQRWLQEFWQRQGALWSFVQGADGRYQPLDATLSAFAGLAGTPNTLPYFTGPDAFALTPLSPYSRSLLALGDAGTWRSTLGLGSGSTITASGVAPAVAYWSGPTTLSYTDAIQVNPTGWKVGMNSYPPPVNVGLRAYRAALDTLKIGAGDTLASYPLDVVGDAYVSGHMGIGAAVLAGQFHLNAGYTQLIQVHVTGAAYCNSTLSVTGTITALGRLNVGSIMAGSIGHGYDPSRWALDINGKGHILQLGCYYEPPVNTDLRVFRGAFDSLSLGRGDTAARWPLDCEAYAYIARLGVAGGPDDRWNFTNWGTVYTGGTAQFAGAVGIGYAPVAGVWLRCGTLQADDILAYGQLRAENQIHLRNIVGIGDWAQAGWTLFCHGSAYFATTLKVAREAGFGRDAVAGWSVVLYEGLDIYPGGTANKAGGGSWGNNGSSRTLKRNIRNLTGALAQLLILQGRQWEWRAEQTELERALPGTQTGFVMEEVEAVRPQWIRDSPTGKALHTFGMEALTVEALREIVQRLETLEERIAWQ